MLNAATLQKLVEYRSRIGECILSPRTRTDYAANWLRFRRWCDTADRRPMPASAETVLLYLTETLLNGGKISSCWNYVKGINDAHRSARIPGPDAAEIREFLKSAQRLRAEKPAKKLPLRVEHLRRICAAMLRRSRDSDIRNRAVLTLGLATALRRSSLVALDVEDLCWVTNGLEILIRREKTDQMAKGRLIGVAPGDHPETDPIAATKAWLAFRGGQPGPLFIGLTYPHHRLGARNIAKIVKAGMSSIGVDPQHYSGHSIRRGYATAAADLGADAAAIMRITGHRNVQSVIGYIEKDPFRGTVSSRMIGM
jgi:integrase